MVGNIRGIGPVYLWEYLGRVCPFDRLALKAVEERFRRFVCRGEEMNCTDSIAECQVSAVG